MSSRVNSLSHRAEQEDKGDESNNAAQLGAYSAKDFPIDNHIGNKAT